jgi:hypothetical protein
MNAGRVETSNIVLILLVLVLVLVFPNRFEDEATAIQFRPNRSSALPSVMPAAATVIVATPVAAVITAAVITAVITAAESK